MFLSPLEENGMEDLTRGQQTVHRLLALLDDHHYQQRIDEEQSYLLDLETLQGILVRALSDPDHPVNAVLMHVRSWGFGDGEQLIWGIAQQEAPPEAPPNQHEQTHEEEESDA